MNSGDKDDRSIALILDLECDEAILWEGPWWEVDEVLEGLAGGSYAVVPRWIHAANENTEACR